MKGKISVWPCFLLLALLPGVAFNATAQALAAEARAFQLPSNRRVSNAVQFALPDQEKLLAYDYRKFGSSETRKRLLTRWINEVNIPANE